VRLPVAADELGVPGLDLRAAAGEVPGHPERHAADLPHRLAAPEGVRARGEGDAQGGGQVRFDALGSLPAMLFQAELTFQAPVHRFDDLPQWLEELLPGPLRLALPHGPRQVDLTFREVFLEVLAEVVLAARQDLAGAGSHQAGIVFDHAGGGSRAHRPWRRPPRTSPAARAACTPGAAIKPQKYRE
jgi:hypothetical protein